MNDIEKTIETLKDMKGVFGERSHERYSLAALDLAISVLEKQIAKKPKKIKLRQGTQLGCGKMINISDLAEHLTQYAEYAFAHKDREELERVLKEYFESLNNRWIPVSERLPNMEECQKNDCRFIVTDGNRVYEDSFDYMADGYIEPHWTYSTMCQPTAWQPLPPKYEEVSQ